MKVACRLYCEAAVSEADTGRRYLSTRRRVCGCGFRCDSSPFAVGVIQDDAVCAEKTTTLATTAAKLLQGTLQYPKSDFYQRQFDSFTVAAMI